MQQITFTVPDQEMANTIILDTNILISAFRRNSETIDFLSKKQYSFAISNISIMEIFAGCTTLTLT